MTVKRLIDPDFTLGELVAERPVRAQLFEQLALDYCCGGRQTLAAACAKRGLDLDEVLGALQTLDAGRRQSAGVESRDWREAGAAELCAHIVTVHHDGLREAFPRIERLLATVVRVHGNRAPQLRDAQRRFSEIRAELEPHLASEETELFPACIAADQTGTPVEEHVLEKHESEHAALGHALVALRILCGDYDRQTARCNTHWALLDALEAFERDLHRHVHEENNILLPRARRAHPVPRVEARLPAALDRATSGPPSETLPACCHVDRGADPRLGGAAARALTRHLAGTRHQSARQSLAGSSDQPKAVGAPTRSSTSAGVQSHLTLVLSCGFPGVANLGGPWRRSGPGSAGVFRAARRGPRPGRCLDGGGALGAGAQSDRAQPSTAPSERPSSARGRGLSVM